MREYDLSSQEGVALMCLAEALLRIPDPATRDALIRDKIGAGDWRGHVGHSPSPVRQRRHLGPGGDGHADRHRRRGGLGAALTRLIARGGEPVIRKGVDMAMRMMGEQFVTGQTIGEALAQRAPAGGARLPLLLRHAGRGGDDRGRRRALLPRLRDRDPRDRPGRGRARHLRGPGHLHQAVGAASPLRPRAARPGDGGAAAARAGPRRAGPAPRHRPQHRRRGGGPAGPVARPAGGAVLRPGAGRLERHRLRGPGLPEARALRAGLDRSTWPAAAATA